MSVCFPDDLQQNSMVQCLLFLFVFISDFLYLLLMFDIAPENKNLKPEINVWANSGFKQNTVKFMYQLLYTAVIYLISVEFALPKYSN